MSQENKSLFTRASALLEDKEGGIIFALANITMKTKSPTSQDNIRFNLIQYISTQILNREHPEYQLTLPHSLMQATERKLWNAIAESAIPDNQAQILGERLVSSVNIAINKEFGGCEKG